MSHTLNDLTNVLRFLAIDSIEQAKSGHPGMPMGMADIAKVLWQDFLSHNPLDPSWPNRDRFILSNGHGAMLQYALLHLTGYDISIDDLKSFRQLHAKTPGHPEFLSTPGVETTTGPLGQGLAQGVGMALAEQTLAAQFNRPNHTIVDHYTYVFVGDGCLMEGISHEACSLAGTLKLEKLIVFWDDNGISIDGETHQWFNENTRARFQAYHWHVIDVDGHDQDAIKQAILQAQSVSDKPSLLACRTHIGHGSPNYVNTARCHGAPLGSAEVKATRKQLNWPHPAFHIPPTIKAAWDATERGNAQQLTWKKQFQTYQTDHPELAEEFNRRLAGNLPHQWPAAMHTLIETAAQQTENIPSRKASQNVLTAIQPLLPELFGGSADLTPSNLTQTQHAATRNTIQSGTYLHFGVREFAMISIMTGMSLHRGFIPYAGTFLTFIDYGRNALRLAAFMQQRLILVLTHDSIGLGEDGPTHQPIEHLAMCRATPNVDTWRPCDSSETVVAWQQAIERLTGPTCLALSRQTLPYQTKTRQALDHIHRGGYVQFSNETAESKPQAIIIATGSEVALAREAAARCHETGLIVRVVSMPCVEQFLRQDEGYQQRVLPPHIKIRIAVEAGSPQSWHRFIGPEGAIIGLESFGYSAPSAAVFSAMNLTADAVYQQLTQRLSSSQPDTTDSHTKEHDHDH